MAGETAKELIESLDNEEAAMLQSNVGNNSPRNPTRQPEGLTVGHDNSTIVSSSSRVKTTSAATHADTIAKSVAITPILLFVYAYLPPEPCKIRTTASFPIIYLLKYVVEY